MSDLSLSMVLNDEDIVVEFNWYGASDDSEPDWETMQVWALLRGEAPEGKHWVLVNSLISDADWVKIEREIYEREDELRLQANANFY